MERKLPLHDCVLIRVIRSTIRSSHLLFLLSSPSSLRGVRTPAARPEKAKETANGRTILTYANGVPNVCHGVSRISWGTWIRLSPDGRQVQIPSRLSVAPALRDRSFSPFAFFYSAIIPSGENAIKIPSIPLRRILLWERKRNGGQDRVTDRRWTPRRLLALSSSVQLHAGRHTIRNIPVFSRYFQFCPNDCYLSPKLLRYIVQKCVLLFRIMLAYHVFP